MQTLTPNSPWRHDNVLTLAQLLAMLGNTYNTSDTANLLQKSLYLTAGNIALRLFNSKEPLATVQALLPNDRYYKHMLGLTVNPEISYHNIKPLRHDYKNGERTTNAKTDLILQRPQEELALLDIDIMELFNDNNSAKL